MAVITIIMLNKYSITPPPISRMYKDNADILKRITVNLRRVTIHSAIFLYRWQINRPILYESGKSVLPDREIRTGKGLMRPRQSNPRGKVNFSFLSPSPTQLGGGGGRAVALDKISSSERGYWLRKKWNPFFGWREREGTLFSDYERWIFRGSRRKMKGIETENLHFAGGTRESFGFDRFCFHDFYSFTEYCDFKLFVLSTPRNSPVPNLELEFSLRIDIRHPGKWKK